MKKSGILLSFLLILAPTFMLADDDIPTISPTAVFMGEDGEEESTFYSGSAPLEAAFYANPENTGGWTEYYEWRFTGEDSDQPYLIRYEQDTKYTFKKAGSTRVVCYAIFTQGNDSICYTQDYWADAEPIIISISESHLDMPNAFSPNGDGINDIYKAKEGYQSLVEFHAAIYNRWGQKLYEWDDPAGGWDGTFHGKDVAQGVYFCRVEAKGADGIKYHFKRDVNLLRGYNEERGDNYE
ncbi:MAG: gliding motility-associated C-terminal domain-containing protein [Prevotellaceae bacterium]|nr:gliding motility-associated C-terminal domain-containing protein [Prevotellaceae bacterium]